MNTRTTTNESPYVERVDVPIRDAVAHATGGAITSDELDARVRRASGQYDRITSTWHRRVSVQGRETYRAVVLFWGKWDVAATASVDATTIEGLWAALVVRGVVRECRGGFETWRAVGEVRGR